MTRHASLQAMVARRDCLSPEDEARVGAHLDECADCRERAADYAAQVTFLRSFRREAAPPCLRDRLLTVVERQSTVSGAKFGRRTREELLRRLWPVADRLQRMTLRWPGIALAAMLAIVVIVLSPLISQRTASPVSADQLLRSAAIAPATPSRGTATISYPGGDSSLMADQVVPHRLTITWAISDAQHYRVEVRTLEPAMDSGTLTTIQNGSSMTEYDTRTRTAGVRTDAQGFPGVLGLAGAALPMGGIAPDQSIQQYLDSTQQDLPSSVPHFARILGQRRLLGREADVVQFAPVVRGIHCVPTSVKNGIWQGFKDCNTPLDYGTATVWLDDATHLILKYQADLANPHSDVRSSLYQVTSVAIGQGASQAELADQPPVAVQPAPAHPAIGTESAGGTPGHAPPVPNGFLAATPPALLPNAYTSAEDLMAQTFERALAAIVRYEHRGMPFSGWLFRIAANLSVDRARRAPTMAHLGEHPELEAILEGPARGAVHTWVERWERADWLQEHVGTLPRDQQRVIRLRFYEDHALADVATEMGRSDGAVRQLLQRAVRTLRLQMQGEEANHV